MSHLAAAAAAASRRHRAFGPRSATTLAATALLVWSVLPTPLAAQDADDSRRCSALTRRAPDADTLAAARRVIAAEPATARGAFYQGCIAFGAENASKAADHFERAVKLDDRNGPAHDWLARAYGARAGSANPITQARLAPKIRTGFERAIAIDPTNLDARAYLVQFYQEAPGMMGGSQEKAWQQIEEIRRLSPYRGGVLAAQSRFAARDAAGTLQEYAALTQQYPDSIDVVSRAAVLYAERGDADRAFALVDGFRARHPESRRAHYLLGRTAAVSGQRLDEGAAALGRYLDAGPPTPGEPSLAGAHYRLGMIAERRGDRATARTEYETALRLDPKLAEAKKALAGVR